MARAKIGPGKPIYPAYPDLVFPYGYCHVLCDRKKSAVLINGHLTVFGKSISELPHFYGLPGWAIAYFFSGIPDFS